MSTCWRIVTGAVLGMAMAAVPSVGQEPTAAGFALDVVTLEVEGGEDPVELALGLAETAIGVGEWTATGPDPRALAIVAAVERIAVAGLEDLVPEGSTLERETRLARWESPMGRLEYQWLLDQRRLGTGGLVGFERHEAMVIPLTVFHLGDTPVRLTLPLLPF